MIAAPHTPPTTPPAIAPVFGSELELELFDVDVGVEDELSSVAVVDGVDVGDGVLVVTINMLVRSSKLKNWIVHLPVPVLIIGKADSPTCSS